MKRHRLGDEIPVICPVYVDLLRKRAISQIPGNDLHGVTAPTIAAQDNDLLKNRQE